MKKSKKDVVKDNAAAGREKFVRQEKSTATGMTGATAATGATDSRGSTYRDKTRAYMNEIGATGVNRNVGDIGHTEVGASGVTGYSPASDLDETPSKPGWFDRTFRNPEGQ